MLTSLDRVTKLSTARLAPAPRIDLATWIEANLVIPEGMSFRAGPVELIPYQRGICDALSDPEVERVTVVKSARLGYTTLLVGLIASYIVNDPSPILVVLPTEAACRAFMVDVLEPIFAESPNLRGVLSEDTVAAGTKSRNTILSRRFPGGFLKLIGGSPRGLRGHNIRVLLVDEAAAMEADDVEGSVVARAITRTTGFPDRKIIEGSTPTDENSNVLLSYENSDQARFEVPCPDCGGFTFIEWRHIRFEAGPETAAFKCPHCTHLIGEDRKRSMVAAGVWVRRKPEVRSHAGFYINALVSPLEKASWRTLAAEWTNAKDNPELLRPFVNTVLAEVWRGDPTDLAEDKLRELKGDFGLPDRGVEDDTKEMPEDVLALTVGVDVQDDRLECSVIGWARDGALYVLDHVVLWGSPGESATWVRLDDLLKKRWRHPLGGTIGVDAAAVDSGDGDWTAQVYAFCFPRSRRLVKAIKGVGGTRPAIMASEGKVQDCRIWIVGIDGVKASLMDRIGRSSLIRFSDTLPPVYYEQLTSEHRVVRVRAGRRRTKWEPKSGARTETLDCLVYGYAVRQDLRIDFVHREAAHRAAGAGQTPPRRAAAPVRRRRVVPSSYMRG